MICKQALNRKLNCGVVLYLVVLTTRKKQVIKKKITKNTCIHCTNKHYTTYKNPNGSCHMDPPDNKHVMFPSTSKTESFPVNKKKNDKRLDRNGSFSTSFAKQVRVIPSM